MESDGRSSGGFIKRLFGKKEDVTEENIRMLVDAGNEQGVIPHSEKEMINNVFEFDDTLAGDIMTHRTDITAISIDDKISDVVYHAINDGFSRIPVYQGDVDNIIGTIYVKDLLCLVGCKSVEDFSLKDFIRKVLYVTESTRCRELFKKFKNEKQHLAVVIDEYGGTSGIVTMEDVIESIVGNIQDEYDNEEEEISRTDDDTFTIDGATDLDDVSEKLGIEFEQGDEYDTLGGYIIYKLERIPQEDETPIIQEQGYEFKVISTQDRRVVKVQATKLREDEKEEKNK